VLVSLVMIALTTGLVFGIVPAIVTTGIDLMSVANRVSPAAGRPRRLHRLREALVAAQISLALILLIVSGLLMKSFLRQAGRELNFDPTGVLAFEYRVPGPGFYRPVGAFQGYPYFPDHERSLRDAQDSGDSWARARRTRHAGCPLSGDRQRDHGEALLAGEDPIGKQFRLDVLPEEQVREVVGVVRDIPIRLNEVKGEPIVYASYLQQPARYRAPWANMHGHMTFMVRSAADPLALVPAVRRATGEVDPNRPIFNIRSVDSALDRSVRARHAYVFVLSVFAVAATLLAAVGLYGVTAYAVAQRTREIGIRIVLGAGAREVIDAIGRNVAIVILAGLGNGIAGSLLVTRLIATQLWTVTPTDPSTFVGVSLLLVVVALGACVIPVLRALRVDPILTLHTE
jgi:putative ABC transport system permease protein